MTDIYADNTGMSEINPVWVEQFIPRVWFALSEPIYEHLLNFTASQ